MQTSGFLKPRIIDVQGIAPNHAKVVMEPFERGYGHTLGNALRRVLLSSMPGYAATEVQIAGVLHEYSTIEGVQEDVVDILLNLKGVVLKLHNREDALLSLKKKGEGPVTAGDIEVTHDVEIINPEHVIAHLSPGGKLEMQIKVEAGRGYLPGNLRVVPEESKGIGKIILDASFSPVKRVSYSVESARVEQRTDLDKLIIDIETNGVIEPPGRAVRDPLQLVPVPGELDRPGAFRMDALELGRAPQRRDRPLFAQAREGRFQRVRLDVVFASSAAVYGEPNYTPVDEKHPTEPVSPYGISKLASEQYVKVYNREFGIKSTIGRIFNTYGPRQSRYVIYDLIQKIKNNRNQLEILGNGSIIRDYAYVSDTVDALILISEKGQIGDVYNIAGGNPISISELSSLILTELDLEGKTAIMYSGASWKGDITKMIADITKLRKLGFKPRITLKSGIKLTLDFFMNH